METFGRYRFTYTPPMGGRSELIEPTIEMTISSEATLSQMLQFCESFLQASGYVFDGELVMTDPLKEETSESLRSNFWEDDGISLIGNSSWSPDTISFSGSGLPGGLGTDVISFGAAQPAMEFGAKSLDDVFTFG